MRVICIQTTFWEDGVPPEHYGTISVSKGSIYHVTGSVDGAMMRRETGLPYAEGAWYQLLELAGVHHSSRFLEIPDDNVLVAERIEETILHNQN